MGGLRLLALALKRLVAEIRGIHRELKRIGDTMELQNAPRGVSLRTFYRDESPTAVDDAELWQQTNAELAILEDLEREARRQRGDVSYDEDLTEPFSGNPR